MSVAQPIPVALTNAVGERALVLGAEAMVGGAGGSATTIELAIAREVLATVPVLFHGLGRAPGRDASVYVAVYDLTY